MQQHNRTFEIDSAPMPASPIVASKNGIDRALSQAHGLLDQLESMLAPVLTPINGGSGGVAGNQLCAATPPRAPLVADLDEFGERAAWIEARLSELIGRIVL